jgi:DNA mismatch repair protein MutS2
VREREREAEKANRQEARRYLLDARQQIERTIRDLKQAGGDALDEQARLARRRAEELAEAQADQLERLEREERNLTKRAMRPAERAADAPPAEGDWVEATTLGNKLGRLMDVRDGTGVVAFGAVKMNLPMAALKRSRHRPDQQPVVVLRGDMPEVYARSEVDVRGMRADEMEDAVYRALDDAVRADLRTLRIIHGKGTGALRERVTEMLQRDTRVKAHRAGLWNEGGTGVTVVEFA